MAAEFQVCILMGSDSDLPQMQGAIEILKEFGISHDVRVLSAHRTPDEVREYVLTAEKNGTSVFIAGAGGAAHLAGVIAAHTTRPVIGVPMKTDLAGGLDSLLSMVQMPRGVPVATVAIGAAGAANAALLAVEILALNNTDLHARLKDYRKAQKMKVLSKTCKC